MFNKIYEILIAGGAWLTILEGLWATVQISFSPSFQTRSSEQGFVL